MSRLVMAVVSVLLLWPVLGAANQPVLEPLELRCTWWPPQTGSQPVRYELQIGVFYETDADQPDGGLLVFEVDHVGGSGQHLQQSYSFISDWWGKPLRARVRAFDALGRPGVWSAWNVAQDWDPEPEF